jgi:hypothetical protein
MLNMVAVLVIPSATVSAAKAVHEGVLARRRTE